MVLLITSIVFLLFLPLLNFSYCQSSTTMQDILSEVNEKVKNLEERKDKEIVNITLDLLVRSSEKRIYRYLDPSFDYDVMVFGDRRINLLKLKICKIDSSTGELNVVAEHSSGEPQMRIKPDEFEQYVFIVTAVEYRQGDSAGHFALILYHENPEKMR